VKNRWNFAKNRDFGTFFCAKPRKTPKMPENRDFGPKTPKNPVFAQIRENREIGGIFFFSPENRRNFPPNSGVFPPKNSKIIATCP